VGTPELGYLKLKRIAVTRYVTAMAHSSDHEHSPPCSPSHKSPLAHGACLSIDQSKVKILDCFITPDSTWVLRQMANCPCMIIVWWHTMIRLSRSRDSNQTLSGFWEVNGTQAHCLLDSGYEGIMVSSNFTRAIGMKLFKLEQPVGLQLACIGSKSTINYCTKATIVFGGAHIEEYFNVANINYYNVSLETLFLRRLEVALDFTSPGMFNGDGHNPLQLPIGAA